jgi:type II secretory pathway pseudopilin PulG
VTNKKSLARGFTLIEALVVMIAGIVLVGAAVAVVVYVRR